MRKIITVTLNPAFDTIVRSGRTKTFPGGKGVNVARALKALGIRATPMIAVAGVAGAALAREVRREGLAPVVFVLAGETRTNTTVVDRNGRVTRVFEPGPFWHREDVTRFKMAFRQRIRGAFAVIFSGSLPPGVPPGFYRDLIRLAKRAKVKTFLDTSGEAFTAGIGAQPFLIKPNRAEAEMFLGEKLLSRRAVKKGLQTFQARGMKRVLLTLGKAGCVLAGEGKFLWTRTPEIRGHAVGCGDAALAGCVAAIMAGGGLEDQIRNAVACGGVAARSFKPGAIGLKAVQRMAKKSRVQQF